MKTFLLVLSLIAALIVPSGRISVQGQEQPVQPAVAAGTPKPCYDTLTTGTTIDGTCTSQYGKNAQVTTSLLDSLVFYANQHLDYSFRYMLLATKMGNFNFNRLGFEKLYRKLSDTAWENAQKIISYITKRGGSMKIEKINNETYPNMKYTENDEINGFTINFMGYALDLEKDIAENAHEIHKLASNDILNNGETDPDITFFLEENFLPKQSESVRKLSGYISDVLGLLHEYKVTNKDCKLQSCHINAELREISIFLFDEYLHSTI